MGGNVKEVVTAWRASRVQYSHPGFFRCLSSLATITGGTGADHVFPGVLATAIPGDDMVQSELSSYLTTILAGILVAVEHLKAGQLSLTPKWAFNQVG